MQLLPGKNTLPASNATFDRYYEVCNRSDSQLFTNVILWSSQGFSKAMKSTNRLVSVDGTGRKPIEKSLKFGC